MRILIVENDWFVADDLRRLLERHGHTVVGLAPDAATAFDLAGVGRPEAAFVDLGLRDGLTGPEIGLGLAKQGMAVIFVTGEPDLAPRDHPNIWDVLAKPSADHQYLLALAAIGMGPPDHRQNGRASVAS